jgi:hypothetical protein
MCRQSSQSKQNRMAIVCLGRLEARWAVFFDALGIRYEYEKEFDLACTHYLPDFWLLDYQRSNSTERADTHI